MMATTRVSSLSVSCEGEEAYEAPSQHHHHYHALMASRDNLVSACCTTVCPRKSAEQQGRRQKGQGREETTLAHGIGRLRQTMHHVIHSCLSNTACLPSCLLSPCLSQPRARERRRSTCLEVAGRLSSTQHGYGRTTSDGAN